jgi:hypothetical protein
VIALGFGIAADRRQVEPLVRADEVNGNIIPPRAVRQAKFQERIRRAAGGGYLGQLDAGDVKSGHDARPCAAHPLSLGGTPRLPLALAGGQAGAPVARPRWQCGNEIS